MHSQPGVLLPSFGWATMMTSNTADAHFRFMSQLCRSTGMRRKGFNAKERVSVMALDRMMLRKPSGISLLLAACLLLWCLPPRAALAQSPSLADQMTELKENSVRLQRQYLDIVRSAQGENSDRKSVV